ncbi:MULTISPECIES: PAS domain-containing protein [unclassified Anaeromyxobacter]|uniref:PAS domain-containing protein n=1 Tax=unclassified Anaeromyxobacter TaxID=2620896 RepID=UPI001F57BAEC|nr:MULTISPECIES: PAS domain-containing protein [unclassified Anaeromyxobacter]
MSQTWRELLMTDHETTERVFSAAEKALGAPEGPTPGLVANLREYLVGYVDRCHNQKEERTVFPLLERAGMPVEGGPLAVMLAEHRQAKSLVERLDAAAAAFVAGDRARLGELREVFGAYAALCKDHFWKENDILYPLAARMLDGETQAGIVAAIEAVEAGLGPDTRRRYHRMADEIVRAVELEDLSYGLDRDVLAAILNTLPVELSFIDEEDRVRYFSHERGEKIFPRSRGAIGTNVRNCHPQKSVHLVEKILADFKAGRREVAEFWIDMGPRKVHIRYWPVRDEAGRYLGCLETVQDVAPIQRLTGQRRLLEEAA